eukprot:scaffold3549_cov128-Skeletonema_menzelii.AAC.1
MGHKKLFNAIHKAEDMIRTQDVKLKDISNGDSSGRIRGCSFAATNGVYLSRRYLLSSYRRQL